MKPQRFYSISPVILTICLVLTITACCERFQGPAKPLSITAIDQKNVVGYLLPKDLPNSITLIPPFPSKDSAANAVDEEVSRKSLVLRGTSRWMLAAEDADLTFPRAARVFSCALNAPITEEDTPHLYRLLRRSLSDASLSTYPAKNYYNRPRPFLINREATCTPDSESHLAKSGSYPSGHTAVGWAWALILSEIVPEQSEALLARGRAFGQSRVICNVHWHSDVMEGLVMGAAVVGRLHADPAFRADLEAAKAEVAAIRKKGLKPLRDCKAEEAALGLRLPGIP